MAKGDTDHSEQPLTSGHFPPPLSASDSPAPSAASSPVFVLGTSAALSIKPAIQLAAVRTDRPDAGAAVTAGTVILCANAVYMYGSTVVPDRGTNADGTSPLWNDGGDHSTLGDWETSGNENTA